MSLLGLALLPLSAPFQPQVAQASGEDLTELSLEALLAIPIRTVYGASKREQKTVEAPSSVTIVTAEEIETYGYRTLADLLRGVRGVFVTDDRNYEHVAVRGFYPPGDYNGRVLLLVDGHRLNENVYGSALIGNDFPLDVDLIDRVEIIRGPGSSLYGSSAFFGVIEVRTKRGADLEGWEFSGEAGSFETYRARTSYGRTLEGGVDLLVSASVFDSAGPRLFYEEFASDPSGGFTSGTDYEGAYSLFSQIASGPWRLQGVYGSRDKGIPTGSFGTVFDDPDNSTRDASGYLDLSYSRAEESRWSFLGRVFYDSYYYRGAYIYDDTANGGPPDLENKDRAWGRWWGTELQGSWLSLPGQHLTGGVEYRHEPRQDQRNYDVTAVYLDAENEGDILGLYVQDECIIRDGLTFDVGVRYDHYDTFGGTANPRLALIWNPDPSSAWKLLYGQAFRAPNAYELYYEDGFTAKSNPDLDPEEIRTYEAIHERYSDGWRLAASIYHYEIDDLVVQVTDPLDGLLVFENGEQVSADGLEFEVERRFESGARVQASHAWQRAEGESSGGRLVNSPDHLFKLLVETPLWEERLRTGLEIQAMSERGTLAGDVAPGFMLANLTLRAPELVKGLDLSFSLHNLFDAEYGDPGGLEHPQDVIAQDGRTALFHLTWRP